jgi:hypothetical protein
MEDFRWAAEFRLFLDAVHQMGAGAIDLVLNGDTFELWESLTDGCIDPRERDAGCTEAEALARVRRVIAAHADELRALGEFAGRSPGNRVVLVPGNHDAALLFPSVARVVLDAIPAPSGRVSVAREGYWLSADGLVYAEHGHQVGNEVNRFQGWPAPFRQVAGVKRLIRPWGEQFVQSYYNQWEPKYPIIDNISEEAAALRYGFAAEGLTRTAVASVDFFKFFLFGVSWEQFVQVLGREGEPPRWDVARIRCEGDRFLVESLATDDPIRAVAEEALRTGRLPVSVSQLSDADIITLCDARAAMQEGQDRRGEPRTIATCPPEAGSLGAITESVLRSRNSVFTEDLKQRSRALGREFAVFVYSHTHRADPGFSPLKGGEWTPLVINTGAWQRVISPAELESLRSARGLTHAEVLRTLQPEDLNACYSAVIVEPYTTRPDAKLRYWRRGAGGQWDFAEDCK